MSSKPTTHIADTVRFAEPRPAGSVLVQTQGFRDVQKKGKAVIARGGLMTVSGPSGAGKSEAVDYLLAHSDVPVFDLHEGEGARGRETMLDLVRALGEPNITNGREARIAAKELLANLKAVIRIEEADRLNADAWRGLRYLRDPDTRGIRDGKRAPSTRRWSLILVGISFERAFALVPEIETRRTRSAVVPLIPRGLVAKTMSSFHPLFKNTDNEILLAIDDRACHGLFQSWKLALDAFLETGLTAEDAISKEQAVNVIGDIWGTDASTGHPRRPRR